MKLSPKTVGVCVLLVVVPLWCLTMGSAKRAHSLCESNGLSGVLVLGALQNKKNILGGSFTLHNQTVSNLFVRLPGATFNFDCRYKRSGERINQSVFPAGSFFVPPVRPIPPGGELRMDFEIMLDPGEYEFVYRYNSQDKDAGINWSGVLEGKLESVRISEPVSSSIRRSLSRIIDSVSFWK